MSNLPPGTTLESTAGLYKFSFLRLYLDTDESLADIGEKDQPDLEAAYLHEYIHFVQDVSTVYGLNLIHVITEYMKDAVLRTRTGPDGPFSVPVRPEPRGENNVEANSVFASMFAGTGKVQTANVTDANIEHSVVHSVRGEHPVERVFLDYESSAGKGKYLFGGYCIQESMAYEIETSCYPSAHAVDELPYKCARKLVELICPRLLDVPYALIALCDASLMYFNPGLKFFQVLCHIRDTNPPIGNYYDVYRISWGYDDILNMMNMVGQNAKHRLMEYFPADEFKPILKWLESVIDGALAYRRENLAFPVGIAMGKRMRSNPILGKFMHHAGSPLVVNRNGEVTTMDPHGHGEIPEQLLLLVIHEIYKIMLGNRNGCRLKETCDLHGLVVTDHRCIESPWQRVADKPPCNFAQVWHSWGLDGKFPPWAQ